MKLSHYAIQQIVPYITGNDYPPNRSGRDLIDLFNTFGCRDVYNDNGLPMNPATRHPMSRKQYVENRLLQLLGNNDLRLLLEQVINSAENKSRVSSAINALLREEGYSVVDNDGIYSIQGGTIDRTPPVQNEAHFNNIQKQLPLGCEPREQFQLTKP